MLKTIFAFFQRNSGKSQRLFFHFISRKIKRKYKVCLVVLCLLISSSYYKSAQVKLSDLKRWSTFNRLRLYKQNIIYLDTYFIDCTHFEKALEICHCFCCPKYVFTLRGKAYEIVMRSIPRDNFTLVHCDIISYCNKLTMS